MTFEVAPFHDPQTGTVTYLVADLDARVCAVVDSVLGYDLATGETDTRALDPVVAHVRERGLSVRWILETHIHADHLSGANILKRELGGQIGIGNRVVEVQRDLGRRWNLELAADGSQFDRLFEHGATMDLGSVQIEVMHTPGHTPACVTYLVGDNALVGDTLLMPDCGTARCDFPGGDAATLYRSLQRLMMLSPGTRIFVGHDYGADGRRGAAWQSTVAEQRATNVHVHDGASEAEFVALRTARDATLAPPQLMQRALRFNLGARVAGG